MKISNETKVGVLAIVAIVILVVGYSFLKGNDVFTNEREYYAIYDDVGGLAVSKPVLVNGYQIGRVSHLSLQPNGQIIAEFKIKPEYEIPVNTIARLESTDLLGSKAIIFELGNSGKSAADGDTLNANVQKNLMEQVQPVQKKAEMMIARMDSILMSMNAALNPDFQRNFNRSFASIAHTLETLESTTRRVDGLVGTQTDHVAAIIANLESISANFKNNNAKLTSIMNNIDKVTDEVAKANFTQTIQNANKAILDFQSIANKINSGEGSIGMLINDKQLYNNLNNSAADLDKLMIDLKANPKRYVHFSVFGGKKND
ncbi:MlaD family protein [Hufsiella ginkgonis]|uniref:MCE family protein n=1 Tax=Hufsiella ginkgonis TaxID=2695274 RepID=A0A7K1XWU7_9SPHI|nr:MlaD family protein [Hufsiella ginkgonis]MXV15258.1 MCE family protein [Hufsiella ginkgonis]